MPWGGSTLRADSPPSSARYFIGYPIIYPTKRANGTSFFMRREITKAYARGQRGKVHILWLSLQSGPVRQNATAHGYVHPASERSVTHD
jgi:hypothetical protein